LYSTLPRQFQQFAMEAEITRFQQLLDTSAGNSMEKLGWFASNGILSFGMVIVTFLIGGPDYADRSQYIHLDRVDIRYLPRQPQRWGVALPASVRQ